MSVKATFVIDDLVLAEARECVKENRIKSLSAFVERAICSELERLRQEKLKAALLAAGNDPMFMADIIEIQQAFEHADHDTRLT